MLDATVLSGSIHGLKDDEESVPVGGIEQFLHGTQTGDVLIEELLVFHLRFVHGLDQGRSPLEVDLFAGMDAQFLGEFFHDLARLYS